MTALSRPALGTDVHAIYDVSPSIKASCKLLSARPKGLIQSSLGSAESILLTSDARSEPRLKEAWPEAQGIPQLVGGLGADSACECCVLGSAWEQAARAAVFPMASTATVGSEHACAALHPGFTGRGSAKDRI